MQGARWVWCGVVLMFITIVFADPRTGYARTVSRRATAEAGAAASGEIYRSAIVVDADSGAVLFEKDPHRQNPPASMTKMMLMLIVAGARARRQLALGRPDHHLGVGEQDRRLAGLPEARRSAFRSRR